MITIRQLKHMLHEAIDNHGLTDESEVRFITRPDSRGLIPDTSADYSITDSWTCVAPDPGNGPPEDRRFGAGVLILAEECVMRCTPDKILNQLDWK